MLLHNHPPFFFGADEMKQEIILCILVLLALTTAGIGLSHADSISSSIICDGAAWLSASVIGPEENYASRFFTSGPGGITRDVTIGPGIRSAAFVDSAGPAGIYEYADHRVNETETDGTCVFRGSENQIFRRLDRIETLGLLRSGIYVSERELSGDQTIGKTGIFGTGMVLTGAVSEGENQTQTSSAHVAGRMNLSEWLWFGGER